MNLRQLLTALRKAYPSDDTPNPEITGLALDGRRPSESRLQKG